jgi:HD-GYP domain-containing protein (c-di-GMP phosphodiesterase class II)
MRPRRASAGALVVAYFDTSMLLELKPRDHVSSNRGHSQRPARPIPTTPSPAPVAPSARRLWRYLPLAIVATAAVIVAPAAGVAALAPGGGAAMTLVSAACAVAVSLILATAGAALWKRQPRSRDVVFADLMLWCWVRRCWTERRLSQARELFDSARRAGLVNIELLLGLSKLLEARDAYVHGHSQRVARHAVRISRAMGLSEREVAKIRTAAEVHDVGKIYTPRAILNNPRRLNDAEFAVVKQHATRGAEMLSVVGDPEITAMVRHHHERIDGCGYPDGLAGATIPLGARIIAVADTFDAITSDRPYRRAGSQKYALQVLSAEAGAQLDADAVAAFQRGYSARRSIGWYAFAATAAQRAGAALQSAISSLGAGGASVASLAPALGAAGLLAVSPGLFRVSHAGQPSAGSLALLQPLRSAGEASAVAEQTNGRGSAGSPVLAPNVRARTGPVVRHPRSPATNGSPPVSAPTTANAGTHEGARTSAAGSAGGSSSPEAPTSTPLPPVAAPPGIPAPPPVPPATVPGTAVPGVSTPTVSTPSITTPSVTPPPVNVPSAAVPGVNIP